MVKILQRGPHVWLWCATIYVLLVAATAVAAVTMLSRSIEQGLEVWPDAQSETQMVAAWRGAAILAYTSGSEVGHVCALLAGLLVARTAAVRSWPAGPAVAVLAGTVLALVNLSLAWWKASPRLAYLTGPVDPAVIDPGLRHHSCVIVAIALVSTAFSALAAAGYGLGMKRNIKAAVITLMVLAALALDGHFILTGLVPRPDY
ncbi:hypothetical protein [Actinomadura sp. NEAU-AAG7]|uniref:hypothetical protein n=1 Tax=Actinomadura sp. NEAU-AAG7 TaxID=2839640 RepID=UPI001BE4D6FD|nr:hypothetical protein [Actinomadura sp. NEAU-AAG7]MBT2212395.1 hypothetical protein [Actinomadura sp. NEAU-AAG7]